VVDFVTYVFVPAYAIAAGGLLPEPVAFALGALVAVTGALYFADTRMKMADNCFRGFPVLWNAVAFYLFLLKPPPWIGAAGVTLLLLLTFVPFPFIHPIRVARWRRSTLAIGAVGVVLAAVALVQNLNPPAWVAAALSAIGLYFLAAGLMRRFAGDAPHA
jgi:phosphatidylcholine synthase